MLKLARRPYAACISTAMLRVSPSTARSAAREMAEKTPPAAGARSACHASFGSSPSTLIGGGVGEAAWAAGRATSARLEDAPPMPVATAVLSASVPSDEHRQSTAPAACGTCLGERGPTGCEGGG